MPMRKGLYKGLGSILSPASKSRAHILANRSKYGIAAAKTRTTKSAANAAMNAAVAKRQTQVGRRALGASVALGGVGMYKNRDGSRGGYSAPSMRTPRGTGRYA